jgi:hypothetical protein
MSLLKMLAPMPNHTYATRGDTVRSDPDGFIEDIAAASQTFTDLVNCGCSVVPPPATPPAEDLPEPVA